MLPSWLGMINWQYDRYFDQLPTPIFDVTDELEGMVEAAALDQHKFFGLARQSKEALTLWVSQELVMTNAFSQLVLCSASQIQNVHARAILSEIAYGEHGSVRNGFAKHAHPWLLEQLRTSVKLPREQVWPREPTLAFIDRLASRLGDPLDAVAFIGVGNERLIAPEYAGIRACFQHLMPAANFEPFLKANIDEDITHSRLCYELAALLISTDDEKERFLQAARDSIQSRIQYFDELTAIASQPGSSHDKQ